MPWIYRHSHTDANAATWSSSLNTNKRSWGLQLHQPSRQQYHNTRTPPQDQKDSRYNCTHFPWDVLTNGTTCHQVLWVCLVLVCWSLTSFCHSNGHIETMPAREINPFTALTGIQSQFLRTQWRAIISEWTRLRLRPLSHRGWLKCCGSKIHTIIRTSSQQIMAWRTDTLQLPRHGHHTQKYTRHL